MASRCPCVVAMLLATPLLVACPGPAPVPPPDGGPDAGPSSMDLWVEIPLADLAGSYPSLGDVDNDGRVDVVLHRMGELTAPGLLAAVSLDGALLWTLGDETLEAHRRLEPFDERPCRGIVLVYDLDEDGRGEVIAELWDDGVISLVVVDGETGRIERRVDSPLDLSVRLPEGYSPWRGHPVGLIARLDGPDEPPSLVLKYGSSNRIPGRVVALSPELEVRWEVTLDGSGVGHVPTVADVDGDGRDELVVGEALLDDDGELLWQQPLGSHADMTAVADVASAPGPEILMGICRTGPALCLDASGAVLWQTPPGLVNHGQGLWAGDFLPEEAGTEVIVLRQGHAGYFVTLRGEDGAELRRFTHRRGPVEAYPDMPRLVRWTGAGDQLWLPADRALVDGAGEIVQTLGQWDRAVVDRLHPGITKDELGVQALVTDLCGDERDELVLYHPYFGESLFVFTGSDGACDEHPWAPDDRAVNTRSYF